MRTWKRMVAWGQRLMDRAAFTIFGQRDPDSGRVDWLAGNGGHGGDGGQTPPHVPYSADWDPKKRRNLR